jgi:hypothetical protein
MPSANGSCVTTAGDLVDNPGATSGTQEVANKSFQAETDHSVSIPAAWGAVQLMRHVRGEGSARATSAGSANGLALDPAYGLGRTLGRCDKVWQTLIIITTSLYTPNSLENLDTLLYLIPFPYTLSRTASVTHIQSLIFRRRFINLIAATSAIQPY